MQSEKQILESLPLARQQATLASATEAGLWLQYIRSVEFRLSLKEGDKVTIDFEDGPEEAIWGGYQSTGVYTWITLWHFTKKGKLYKSPTRYRDDSIRGILQNMAVTIGP